MAAASSWLGRLYAPIDSVDELLNIVATANPCAVLIDRDDPRSLAVLQAAQRLQPDARRFVRSTLRNKRAPDAGEIIQGVIDRDAGLDALVEALSSAFGAERAVR